MNYRDKITAVAFRLSFIFITLLAASPYGNAQKTTPAENGVFWEITGKDLKTPSYLFGTFHLKGNLYVDSLTQVMAKYNSSKTIVGEMVMDSTMAGKMMMASALKGTTLDKLLAPDVYQETGAWIKDLIGYDIKMLNGLNPATIQLLIMMTYYQKHYPMDPTKETPMDLYFQNLAKKNGKKVVGLETIEVQLNALYGQFTYERQAEMLTEFVKEKDKALDEMKKLNAFYKAGDLTGMDKYMTDRAYYSPEEQAVMLDNRNRKWMEALPDLFREQSTFVAVGALHLAGKNGLVSLLRAEGYKLKPVAVK